MAPTTELRLPDGTVYLGRLQYTDDNKPKVVWITCGTCGFTWNDALITDITPTPAGRCPNEHNHEDQNIACRARVSDQCLDGQPMSVEVGGPGAQMSEDGTYDGESIVCDPCYTMLIPFTRSQSALLEELPEAIALVRSQLDYVRKSADPAGLAKQAEASMSTVRPGSPYYNSARASKEMAEAEVQRRKERLCR